MTLDNAFCMMWPKTKQGPTYLKHQICICKVQFGKGVNISYYRLNYICTYMKEARRNFGSLFCKVVFGKQILLLLAV